MLDEVDVFLKYELHDKARDLIRKLLQRAPERLEAYQKRRRLYESLDEPEAEAATLIDMARLCGDQPGRARNFLREASELGADERDIERAASEIGVELADVREQGVANHGQNLDESTAILDETPRPGGEPRAGGETPDSDQPMALDSNEFDVIEDSEDEFDEITEGDPGDEIIEKTEISEEADFSEEELEAVESVDPAAQPDGGFGSAHETKPPGQEAGPEGSDSRTGGGLDFSSEELDGAIDGIFDGRSEDELQPTDEGVLAEVDALIDTGDYAGADEALEAVEQQYPDHPGIESRRREIQRRGGNAFERHPTGSRSLSGEFEAQGLDDGESVAEQVEREAPERVAADVKQTNLELGRSYLDMEMYDEAIREFQDAIANPDAAPAAKYYIAVCKAEKGQTEEAAEDLSRLLRYDQLSGDLREAAREKLDELEGTPN
jgi:tetratricopeptide (TPR) repeat protein